MGPADFDVVELDAQIALKKKRDRAAWGRRKLRVQHSFAKLIKTLGGKCEACKTTRRLSIQHWGKRTYDVAALSWPARVARYWEEFKSGTKLGVLCLKCNGSDGAKRLKRLIRFGKRSLKRRRRR